MEISTANLHDLSSLRHMEKVCFPKDAWPLLDLISVLTWPGVIRLKAVIDGKMVGFIAGDPRPAENMAWIATISVLPGYQRQGIGQALLSECEQRVSQAKIRLCVRESNEPAINLYKRDGFFVTGTWQKYYDDKENALVMEKYR